MRELILHLRGGDRNAHNTLRPMRRTALDAKGAAVGFDDLLHQIQAQAGTLHLIGQSGLRIAAKLP